MRTVRRQSVLHETYQLQLHLCRYPSVSGAERPGIRAAEAQSSGEFIV